MLYVLCLYIYIYIYAYIYNKYIILYVIVNRTENFKTERVICVATDRLTVAHADNNERM